MSKKKGRRSGGNAVRDATAGSEGLNYAALWMLADGDLKISGYTRLSECPEIVTAVNRIASLIGSMTIRLMQNTDHGDIRIRNELSRKIDITPNPYMSRMALISSLVRTLILDGNGNAVAIPRTQGGYLESIEPVPPSRVTFQQLPDRFGYEIQVNGTSYDPAGLLHFRLNPDPERPWLGTGYRVSLKDVADTLRQAEKTKQAFLSSKYRPQLVVRVDSWNEELGSEDGRRSLLEKYVANSTDGLPWVVPADGMQLEQIKPLTLTDLAINDTVNLDKQTAAAILGVPPFILGVGSYNREEWNNFISTGLMPIVKELEQEFTRKLLYSNQWFIKFNPWSLYAYDLGTLASIGGTLLDRGVMTGNELRDWMMLPPLENLDDPQVLENYIPQDMMADQSKLQPTDSGQQEGEANAE